MIIPVIVIGYTNIDINIWHGSKTIMPGGAAYFVALAASRMHKPVGLVTRVGNDFDTSFLFKHVEKDGVHIIPDNHTARSTQIYHSDTDLTDRSITLDWGVAPNLNPQDIPTGWIEQARFIHIATMPPKQQETFVTFMRSRSVKACISIDTDITFLSDNHNRDIIASSMRACDMIFANRREYESMHEIIDAAPTAIVKQDSDGAYFMKQGTIVERVSAKAVQAIDVTGAGDIFAGTFIGSQARGDSTSESLQKATDIATESVTKNGINHLFD